MKKIDILSFNTVADCSAGFDLEMKNPYGDSLGFSLKIIGKHSDQVVNWVNSVVNKHTVEAEIARRKNKPLADKTMQELRSQNIEGAMVRVIGWSGVEQAFDKALLKTAIENNPHWIDQIVEASDDLGNFTKPQ
mgnify:FL=1